MYLELKNGHDEQGNIGNGLKILDKAPKSVKKVFYKQDSIIFCNKRKSI